MPECAVGTHTGRVAVVGGGHTAATAAWRVIRHGGRVDLFAPDGLRVSKTDVEPGWFGPKYLDGFAASTPAVRLARLRDARRGTTTPQLAAWLRARIPPGLLRVVPARVHGIERGPGGTWVHADGRHGPYEQAYEALGYAVDVARLGWLVPHVGRRRGRLPILDRHLQTAPGLHLLGPLAELELGPAGRNLWGAQRAVERLTAAVAEDPNPSEMKEQR
ncbi:MAG: hypothetical protein ACRD0K_14775 [Egibacteraceae bacterium]